MYSDKPVFGQKEIEVRRPTITNCSRKCVPFVRTANEAAVKPLIAPFIGLSGDPQIIMIYGIEFILIIALSPLLSYTHILYICQRFFIYTSLGASFGSCANQTPTAAPLFMVIHI